MPFVTRPCGARIHYQVRGAGPPVLLLAPGGMRSCIAGWLNQPYDAWSRLPRAGFRVIAMDQRNGAGLSTGPLSSGWDDFRDDQMAILDHLDIERGCLLVGSCIGPSFQLGLLRAQPDRFAAAVMMQPIGLARHTTEPGVPWEGENTFAAQHWFGGWASEAVRDGLAGRAELSALYESMFGSRSFVFSTEREEAAAVDAPLLVLGGIDANHPAQIARELASLAPNAELLERWRDSDWTPEVDERIEAFLARHAGSGAAREPPPRVYPDGVPLEMPF